MGEFKPQDERSGLVERNWTRELGLTERTLEGKKVKATFLDPEGCLQQATGKVGRNAAGVLVIKSRGEGWRVAGIRRHPRRQCGRDRQQAIPLIPRQNPALNILLYGFTELLVVCLHHVGGTPMPRTRKNATAPDTEESFAAEPLRRRGSRRPRHQHPTPRRTERSSHDGAGEANTATFPSRAR